MGEAALLTEKMEEGAMSQDVAPLEARKGQNEASLEPPERPDCPLLG